jgi:hypothetical protein
MYNPTLWQDEVVEYPYRYTETKNDDGTIDHTPAPGEKLKEGTPQSATNFGHMENGIHDAQIAESIFMQYKMHEQQEVERRLDEHDAEFSSEVGTVTLTNTNAVFFAFNNSGSTVALKTVRKTMNYDLDIEVTEYSGGQLGEVVVYDKQLNGFKLKFTGSAKSVTVKYKVRGGMYA